MKGLVVTADHRLTLATVSDPRPGPFEALVRIRACGICSTTDRELIRGTQPYNKVYPCLLGHEGVGQVVEVGARVTSFKPGDWVTRPAGIFPGETRDGLASAWGGFAELGVVRDRLAMSAAGDAAAATDYTMLRQNRIAAEGLDAGAMVLAISLAETASWSWQLPVLGGATVCVAGTGIAGLSIALWAKLAGARQVIVLGRRAERLEVARQVAADATIDTSDPAWPARLRELSGGALDVFCEASGSNALMSAAVSVLRPGGVAAIYSAPAHGDAPFDRSTLSEGRSVITPEAREHLAYPWVCDLLRRQLIPVDRLMTHRWALADFATAFAAVAAGGVVKGRLEMG